MAQIPSSKMSLQAPYIPTHIQTYIMHSMDPKYSPSGMRCGFSHKNTN
jgi:hypothetical protein